MTDTPDATSDSTDGERSSRRRHRLKIALLAAMLAVVLVALSLVGARMLGWWPQNEEPAAEPTSSPTPTQPPSPFAGTPPEEFAEGESGIVLPEAEPIGDFTAEEVADALDQVRRALIAARLDHTMLIDHNPDEFLALLAPDHQLGRVAEFDTGDFHAYATQIAEGAVLAPAPPRVRGEITYDATTVEGGLPAIEIRTSFVWVYAVEEVGEGSASLVVVRDRARWETRQDERWLESSRGLWLAEPESGAWGADCAAYSEGLLQPKVDPPAEPASEPDAIFGLDEPLDVAGAC